MFQLEFHLIFFNPDSNENFYSCAQIYFLKIFTNILEKREVRNDERNNEVNDKFQKKNRHLEKKNKVDEKSGFKIF